MVAVHRSPPDPYGAGAETIEEMYEEVFRREETVVPDESDDEDEGEEPEGDQHAVPCTSRK